MKIKPMSAHRLAETLGLETVLEKDGDREVTCGYAGDLLSWVMGRAPEGCAWVTVMSNVNVIAVATLADVGCVILAEGAALDGDAMAKAEGQTVNIYRSRQPIFEICAVLAAIG